MKIGVYCKKDNISFDCLNFLKSECDFEFCNIDDNDIDLILAIGGDGTILKCVPYAVNLQIPILSINTGNLGFLTSFSSNDLQAFVNQLNLENFTYEERTLLECELNDNIFYALNEVIVERDNSAKCETNKYSLTIGDTQVHSLKADGYIISTPTGSTAYSLSAGGPIVYPTVEAFIATPVCAHSFKRSSIIYPQTEQAIITLQEANSAALVFCDGALIGKLDNGNSIKINKSSKTIKIAVTNNFFTILNSKLKG